MEKCEAHNDCTHWSLNTNTNNCCLKDEMGTVTINEAGRFSGSKYCPEICYAPGVDYIGNDIADLTGIQSAETCQLKCQQNCTCWKNIWARELSRRCNMQPQWSL